jgi:hypothetical protein
MTINKITFVYCCSVMIDFDTNNAILPHTMPCSSVDIYMYFLGGYCPIIRVEEQSKQTTRKKHAAVTTLAGFSLGLLLRPGDRCCGSAVQSSIEPLTRTVARPVLDVLAFEPCAVNICSLNRCS